MDITSVTKLYQVSRRVLWDKEILLNMFLRSAFVRKNNIASIVTLMPANLDKHARALFVQRKLTAVKNN